MKRRIGSPTRSIHPLGCTKQTSMASDTIVMPGLRAGHPGENIARRQIWMAGSMALVTSAPYPAMTTKCGTSCESLLRPGWKGLGSSGARGSSAPGGARACPRGWRRHSADRCPMRRAGSRRHSPSTPFVLPSSATGRNHPGDPSQSGRKEGSHAFRGENFIGRRSGQ